jgi:hypothetical protein
MPVFATTRPRRPHKTITLPSAHTVLTRQKGPITTALQTQLEQLIDADAARLVHDLAARDQQAHTEAIARAEHVTQQLHETTTAYNTAQAEYQAARTSPWSLFSTLLFGSGACAAALCEYYITNTTLPSVLEVARTSLLGIAVSLGPTVAFLFVEKPLEHLQQSTWHKTYITFLWLVLAATLAMVWALADVRHEIIRIGLALVQGKTNLTFNDTVLNHAILAVSLLLVLDGAFFLLWARQSGRPWLRYRRARARVRRLQKRCNALHQRQTRYTAEVAACRAHLDNNRAALLATHFTQQCRVALARLTVADPTSAQQVEYRLGLQFRPTVTMN